MSLQNIIASNDDAKVSIRSMYHVCNDHGWMRDDREHSHLDRFNQRMTFRPGKILLVYSKGSWADFGFVALQTDITHPINLTSFPKSLPKVNSAFYRCSTLLQNKGLQINVVYRPSVYTLKAVRISDSLK